MCNGERLYRAVKRFLDVTASFLGLVLLSPLLLAVSILIKIDSRGPVIFRQTRIGRNGKVFEIYKFRSMCVGAEKTGSGVYSGKGDARVTRIGKILRATSIDELPQLLNILKGEMSFVGPRPPLTYHPWKYEEYTDFQKRMFEVRPGITGWAQVNGRKDVEWHKRIELNVWYVDHMSLLLDIKIMFMTAFKVLTNADNENSGATVNKSTEPSNDAKGCEKIMALKLMYLTNDPKIAKIAQDVSVDRIFLDLETRGKAERQANMDTVISHNSIDDVKKLSAVLDRTELLVRVNSFYNGSREEINRVIDDGADIVMLPYFKTAEEVKSFTDCVGKGQRTCLLVETPEAAEHLDEILDVPGIDEVHIA